jgi:hypothetical protein
VIDALQSVCLALSEGTSTLSLQIETEDIYALGDCGGYHPKTGKSVLPALAQVRFTWPLSTIYQAPCKTLFHSEGVRFLLECDLITRRRFTDMPDSRLPIPAQKRTLSLPIKKTWVSHSATCISFWWAFLRTCLCKFWQRQLGPQLRIVSHAVLKRESRMHVLFGGGSKRTQILGSVYQSSGCVLLRSAVPVF